MTEGLYTTWGSVRGCCGHAHRTLSGAERCLNRDRLGCFRQGGYSDRQIRVVRTVQEISWYDVTCGPGQPVPQNGIG